jgi:hypothetical protein
MTTLLLLLIVTLGTTPLLPAPSASVPTELQQHDRANHAMGFDQDKTTHHFLIEGEGGTIEVTAKDAADRTSIDQIRGHLQHIAVLFAKGDFSVPMLVHDQTPPGAKEMNAHRDAMTFKFEPVSSGGKVVIRTMDARARAALHEFLRFQIREHRTGDPLEPR